MTDYNDGKWHGWNGGECPVHPKSVVEWVVKNGGGGLRAAGDMAWRHIGVGDIIALRVIKQYVEPPQPREFWLADNGTWYNFKGSAVVYSARPDELIHVREVMPGDAS